MITLIDDYPGAGMTLRTPPASTSGPGPVARPGSGGECTPSRANLDLNDKLIKRGLLVSFHGWRGTVERVRMGRCLVRFNVEVQPCWLDCAALQVVTR